MTVAERQVLDDVDENGLHVVHVPEGDEKPAYSYSVGLWHSFGTPEVLVFGLEPEIAGDLIEAVADEAAEGRAFAVDSRHDGLLHGYSVRFVAVPDHCRTTHLPLAHWAYGDQPFPILQLVWPDKQGRWPWSPDARVGFRSVQPVLSPPEDAS